MQRYETRENPIEGSAKRWRKKNIIPEGNVAKAFVTKDIRWMWFLLWLEGEERGLDNKLLANMEKSWKHWGIGRGNIHALKEKVIENWRVIFMAVEAEMVMMLSKENDS
jgi:hypothetical protein